MKIERIIEKVKFRKDGSLKKEIHESGWTTYYRSGRIKRDYSKATNVIFNHQDDEAKMIKVVYYSNTRFRKRDDRLFKIRNRCEIEKSFVSLPKLIKTKPNKMNKELLERTIEQLTWALEQDVDMLKWEQDKPKDERDEEMEEHYSWIIEERTDIIKQLSKLQ